MLSLREGKELLKLARGSIKEEFSGKKILLGKYAKKKFLEKRGIFVTLKKNKQLRGCIGFPYPDLPLYEAVYKAAKEAAFHDPRFLPLSENELKNIKIEISVLTSPEKCKAREIKIGKDGLICSYNGFSGLLLPQVAVEWKMSKEKFLKALCEKAGLPGDKWKDKDFKLYKFQAEIFNEEK